MTSTRVVTYLIVALFVVVYCGGWLVGADHAVQLFAADLDDDLDGLDAGDGS